MSFSTSFPRTSERPTLPPLHSLDLTPLPPRPSRAGKSNEISGKSPRMSTMQRSRYARELRKASISSSNTSGSERSPTPECDPPASSSPSPSPTPTPTSASFAPMTPSGQVRLVRCDIQEANALILVPAPDTPFTHPVLKGAKPGQSLLLVGHAMQQFVRHPQREISRGARMHPYRAIPITSNSSSRRSSVISTTSSDSLSRQ